MSKLPLQVWNQFSSALFKKLAELPQSWQIAGAIHGCNFARLLYMRWWAMMVGPKIMFDHLVDSSKPGPLPSNPVCPPPSGTNFERFGREPREKKAGTS